MNRPFAEKCRQLDDLLGVGRCFDMVSRELYVGDRRAKLWVVNGYAKDLLLERAVEKLQAIPTLADIPDLDALLRRYSSLPPVLLRAGLNISLKLNDGLYRSPFFVRNFADISLSCKCFILLRPSRTGEWSGGR